MIEMKKNSQKHAPKKKNVTLAASAPENLSFSNRRAALPDTALSEWTPSLPLVYAGVPTAAGARTGIGTSSFKSKLRRLH